MTKCHQVVITTRMFCLFAATLSFTPAFRPAFMAVEQSGLPATLGALTGAATAAAMAPYVAGGAGSMQAAVAAETTMQAPQAEIAGSIVFSVALVYVFLHYNKKYAGVDLLEEWPEACLIEAEEQLCGNLSFDSTDDYVCIETWENGKLRWACS